MDITLIMVGIALFVGYFGTTGILMFLEWNRWRKHAASIRSACQK